MQCPLHTDQPPAHWPLLGWQGAHLRPLGHGHVAHPSVPGVDAARLAHQGGRLLLQSEEDGLLGHRHQEYQQTLRDMCTDSCIRRYKFTVSRFGMSRTSRRMQCSFLSYSTWIAVEISSRTQNTPKKHNGGLLWLLKSLNILFQVPTHDNTESADG